MELLLPIEPLQPGRPRRVQLESALRDAVRGGRLAAGQRLPASRVLAGDLGVSRRLVVEVYTQLTAEGYLVSRPGSGTCVSDLPLPPAAGVPAALQPAEPPARWDMRPGIPALSAFPRSLWRRAWTAALGAAADSDLAYPDPAGHPQLRQVLAAYLRRVRGVDADPQRLLICAGFTQGLHLLAQTLHARGARTVALEDPGLPHRAPILRQAGLAVLPVPVDADGILVDRLPEQGVDAVLTTPAHQFPTGAIMAPARREAVLAWAGRCGAIVVEDDYDGEFRFDRRAVGCLQGRAPDRVVYLGSTSKSLAPAVRLGWLVTPAGLHAELLPNKFLADHGSPTLDQLALAHLVEAGDYDRHIRAARTRYRTARQALEQAITRHGVPLQLTGTPAGVQTLATQLDDTHPDQLTARARALGIAFDSITRYQLNPDANPRGVVIGYGNIAPHAIDEAIALLATVTDGPLGSA
ncbi:PLP-dependent aminotransferase family protein [Amycolatopsis sp. FDAARGOS 1241]|uniref:MocR-like pyridoxine biosynthesis transcription factor PdxR n=1 Tax=Amycolatopsis sp. FDAARGOS 1241 TaxID=2778070 RepID=UPI00194E45E2|nr:PLP-dependent aminotransferase family protein [Amycolatopsis sp. FDAARGOS 1241]QRP48643.1 PLP-dependent aminotransferase family protein [Amycolatopsis sp. FDAARGOS 1241]